MQVSSFPIKKTLDDFLRLYRQQDLLSVECFLCRLTIASVILDCVLHHCTVINIKGESCRLAEYKELMRQKQQVVTFLFEQGST